MTSDSFNKRTNKQRAFTLVELLVVIAVTGLLGSIIFAVTRGAGEQGRIARGLYFSQHLQNSLGSWAVGIWKFDEGIGATANDTSGWENNGTIYGATYTADTPSGSGYALSFNGVNDYVEVQNNPSLNPTSAITVSAWVKPATGTQSQKPVVLKSYTSHTTPHYQYYIFYTNTVTPSLSFGVNINGTNRSSGSYQDVTLPGRWAYVVGTYDGSRVRLFVDGIERSISDEFIGSINSYDTELHLGRYRNLALSSTYCFGGLIDEARIYATAFPSAFIESQYYAGLDRLLVKNQIAEQEYRERLAI